MISFGDTIVVGVSGGSDSMLLLHFLVEISKDFNLKIVVAHVNHCLRGKESFRDENFVRHFCKKNGLIFKLLKVDIKKIAKEKKIGLEECGRNLRYEFFNSFNIKNYKIAVAHNLSDYVETVIFNLARGSGLHGLLGIQAKRNNIIRPLIYLKKSEIKDYCIENNISFVEDSSNFSDEYTRNKIRLNVVPILKEINPNFENSVLNMGKILKSDDEYLEKVVENCLNESKIKTNIYDLTKFYNFDDAIKARCIKKILSNVDFSASISYKKMKIILNAIFEKNGVINLSKNIFLKIKENRLEIFRKENNKLNCDWELNLKKDNISLTANERMFIIKVVEKQQYDALLKADANIFYKALDYDKLPDHCVFRNRREHDVFRPINRNVGKSLKKFFNEQKIDANKRYRLAIIANDNRVFWIESIGSSNEVKVDFKTKKVLIITEEIERN